MDCEFCDTQEYKEGFPKPYNYGGGVAYSCSDCVGKHIPTDNLTPIKLPEGFEIINSKKLHELKRGSKSFEDAHDAMTNDVSVWHINSGYKYDLAPLYKRIVTYFENRLKHDLVFHEQIGVENFDLDKHYTGGYCPLCAGPLLKMIAIKRKHALFVATSKLVEIMKPTREKRNKRVLVCLRCGTAYK